MSNTERHSATQHAMKVLQPNPNLRGKAAIISQDCWDLAQELLLLLEDGPELWAGLRKLREAKDCFVMQAVLDEGGINS